MPDRVTTKTAALVVALSLLAAGFSRPARAQEAPAADAPAPLSSPTATLPAPPELPTDDILQPLNPLGVRPHEPPPPVPLDAKQIVEFMDLLHGEFSKRIVDTAEWMDSFFAEENYIKEKNRSYARFRNDFFKEEGARLTYKPAFDVRLALPELERKTHLILSAEPAPTSDPANAPAQTAAERFGAADQSNVTTAVHYIFRSTAQESFFTRAGLQFHNLRPVVFVEPRYRALFPMESWNFRFTQDVLWKSNTSWKTDTRFELERLLPWSLFFRTSLDGIWASRVKGYLYVLAFSVRQPLTRTHALDYAWINSYETRPTGKFMETSFIVRYRHSFWRDWLFFEIAPQVRFPRAENFRSMPGVLFKFEALFGG